MFNRNEMLFYFSYLFIIVKLFMGKKSFLLFETDCYDSSVAPSYYLTESICTFSSTYLDS